MELLLVVVLLVLLLLCQTTTPTGTPLGALAFDVYVINLPRDTRRLAAFSRAYQRSDLADTHSFILREAVDGRSLALAEHVSHKALEEVLQAERVKYRRKHYELSRGAIGCWLSHVNTWKYLLATDKCYALIFEDDAVMAPDTLRRMHALRPPADWDIVLLGYVCNVCEPHTADVLRVDRFFGLHGYMISAHGVRKILASDEARSITKQIDSVLSDLVARGALNVYAAREEMVWQNNRDHPTTVQMPIRRVRGVDMWE